VERATQHEIMS